VGRSPRRSDLRDLRYLRSTFEEAPELYDRSRPVLPDQVFDDLVVFAGLQAGGSVVEIGCGTGQATEPLARRGIEIIAIELGERLATLAQSKLVSFPSVKIIVSSFEDWDPGAKRFDAVIAVNSFHWLDPELRFAKSAELLNTGGALAVVGSRILVDRLADPIWAGLQADYAEVGLSCRPWAAPGELRDRSAEFATCGFRLVATKRYLVPIRFDTDTLFAFLQTSPWHHVLDEAPRCRLFARVRERLEARSSSTIAATMVVALYIARPA
jgi:SAM-dependent methyltransferase